MKELNKIECVAAYIRVSSQEQKLHGLSLSAQKMKLQEYADKNNMKIVEWYMDEGISGRKPISKRPELQRMIEDAEKKKFERIIFIKLDRFFRSVAEYYECMKRISPVLWSTTEEKYDLTTANGRMFVNMKLTIAELEADQTGERIRIVNDYKVQVGQPLVGNQSLPFGYKNGINEITGKKKIIKDKDKAHIVEDLIDFVFTHQSKRKAVPYLQEKYNINLTYESVSNLLRNPMICGEYRGNKNYCEAYITKEEFDKLQLITRNQVKDNTKKRDYIFSGLIVCPECGNKLSGCPHTTIKKDGTRYKYKRYRCRNHFMERRCGFGKFVSENVLERQLIQQINSFFQNEKILAETIDPAQEENQKKQTIENLKTQISRLNYSWQTGKILEVEQYEKQYSELIHKLKQAENIKLNTPKTDFVNIQNVLHNGWEEMYLKLSDKYKRAFWRGIIRKIEIKWENDTKTIVRVVFL